MPSVLFVCTANRFRSPLAEAVFKRLLDGLGISAAWQVSSAGTWATPGQPALPLVADVAQSFGLDLSGHRSRRVDRQFLQNFDLILVMQAGQHEALVTEFPGLRDSVYLLSTICERRVYDIPDAMGSEHEVSEVLAELDSLIRRGLESICVMATYLSNTNKQGQGLA